MPNKEYPWSMYRGLWTALPSTPKGDYLKDKVVIVTGANSGVGLEATKAFAAASPSKLILAVRNVQAGEKVLADLKARHPSLNGEVIYLDLTDLNSVKIFAENVKKLDRVDLLVNNAGVNPNFDDAPYRATGDGYERVFQTNVLATLLLTLLLLPQIKASGEPKIIVVGSDGHAMADETPVYNAVINRESILKAFNTAEGYENGARYFQTKLLLQMVTRSLIPNLPQIKIINVNPGLARTNIGRDFDIGLNIATLRIIPWILINARSASSASRNITTAAAWGKDSHDYWSECAPSYSEATFLTTGTGMKATAQFYKEILEEAEKISPGCTKALES